MNAQTDITQVPGTVLHHTPAFSRLYNGCPSIAVLPSGEYIASHSYFGPNSTQKDSLVYRSSDRGDTWLRIAELHGQIWSKLFVHSGQLYIIGTDQCDRVGERLGGCLVLRRSPDHGETWTEPNGPKDGLLTDEAGYHTAPVPLAVHNGRIWKACESAPGPDRKTWQTFALSAPADSDLLDRSNWTFSERIDPWPGWQWIEGNAVVTPDGEVVILSRTNDMDTHLYRSPWLQYNHGGEETAAMIHVSEDGLRLTHDLEKDLITFPGGGTKFTIRFDDATETYCALVNPQSPPNHWRNRLALSISRDLRTWHVIRDLLFHPDPCVHGFQYVDWDIDGDDLIFLSRTAYDDEHGGAHSAHDANYTTFHRLENFRQYLNV